jgi:hypothetical protein
MLKNGIKSVVLLFLTVCPVALVAQEKQLSVDQQKNVPAIDNRPEDSNLRESTYRLETFGYFSSGSNTPFWLVSHTSGVVSLEAQNYYARAGVFHKQSLKKGFSYQLGLDLVGSTKQTNREKYWIQQVYAEIQWKSLLLGIGSKEEYQSNLVDPKLSSGDMVYSNNVRPNPEVKISIPTYTAIPLTKKLLYFKGDFAVGKFLDGDYQEKTAAISKRDYVKDVLSHRKSLFLRVGNVELKENGIQAILGFNHQTQWGGERYYVSQQKFSKYPQSISDFGRSAFPTIDTRNGVHLASYNFRLDYGKGYGDELYSIYWQHLATGEADLRLQNSPDMLLGLQYKSLHPKLLSGFVFEYIYTKQQRSPKRWYLGSNYYDQSYYPQGRSYFGRTIGNPLLLSPEYNEDGYLGFRSNRIFALHSGIEGHLSDKFQYGLLATYGESYGTYNVPYSSIKSGVASALDITYSCPRFPGLSVKCSLAFNGGGFFGSNAFGGGVSIKKTGKLF